MNFFAKCLFGLLALVTTSRGEEFEYIHQPKWYDDFAECSLNTQSPIELISSEATISYAMPALGFPYYNTTWAVSVSIENNGHTANIVLPKPTNFVGSIWQYYDKFAPQITGGPLPGGSFIAESIHFHWGSTNKHGSEHVIDSKRFSMEMHIVHRNTKYSTIAEAQKNKDGLAVLAVMYNVEDIKTDFTGLTGIVSALPHINDASEQTKVYEFNLAKLFGTLDTSEFFTYSGSLTTPPCSQSVTWIVFAKTVPITNSQMLEFRAMIDNHGDALENNYRALQAKGQRQVILRKNKYRGAWNIIKEIKPMPYDIVSNNYL